MDSIKNTIEIAVEVILTAAITITIVFAVTRSREAEAEREYRIAQTSELLDVREWSKYTGTVSGADVVDFIVTHKDVCDIIISDTAFSSKVTPYVRDNKLVMGPSDALNIPENFWTISFAYDYIINAKGNSLYDGKVIDYGSGITGISFTAK